LSLTPLKEQRLKALENGGAGERFGPKRDEVTGGWRKLHNEKFRDLYYSTSIIKMMKPRMR
jgi:hypothetical protein